MLTKTLSVLLLIASASACTDQDAELSPDKSSYYIPSRCTSLNIDGDHSRLDMLIAAIDMHPSLTAFRVERDPWRAHAEGGVNINDVDHIIEMVGNTNIVELSLAFNSAIGDHGAKLIAESLNNELKNIKILNLQSTGIEYEGFGFLTDAISKNHGNIESLNIARNAIGQGEAIDGVGGIVDAIKKHSTLRHVNDEGTPLKNSLSTVGHAVRTLLKGECVTSKWSDWSACNGPCGSSQLVHRERKLLHRPHSRHLNEEDSCPIELYDEKTCHVRCRDGMKIHHAPSIPKLKHHDDGSKGSHVKDHEVKDHHNHKHKDKKGRHLLSDESHHEESILGSVYNSIFSSAEKDADKDIEQEKVKNVVEEETAAAVVEEVVEEEAAAEVEEVVEEEAAAVVEEVVEEEAAAEVEEVVEEEAAAVVEEVVEEEAAAVVEEVVEEEAAVVEEKVPEKKKSKFDVAPAIKLNRKPTN